MYRIVVGVDTERRHASAVRMLLRLEPTGAVVDAVHAISLPPVFAAGEYGMVGAGVVADTLRAEEDAGHALSREVECEIARGGLEPGDAVVSIGPAAQELIDHADRTGASLIAVGSSGKGPVRALLAGSVSRALVVGAHQSVLIARSGKSEEAPAAEGDNPPLRVVLATDHSAYMDRCIPRLLDLAPRGIAHLTVVTCYPRESARSVRHLLPEFIQDPAELIWRRLEERNECVIQQLAPLGCTFDHRVVDARPDDGIRTVMAETGADLLIVGAQGHGFFERLTLGSTSFHHAIAEPYSVLVLRVPPGEMVPARPLTPAHT
jgi:Universal stress protein UspA and related nucleotide-binding proteins